MTVPSKLLLHLVLETILPHQHHLSKCSHSFLYHSDRQFSTSVTFTLSVELLMRMKHESS